MATPGSVHSTFIGLQLRLRLGGRVVGSVLVADIRLRLRLRLRWF